jgi:hypothetical protein
MLAHWFYICLVRALIASGKAEPALNASYDAASMSLRENPTIDLGLAPISREKYEQ